MLTHHHHACRHDDEPQAPQDPAARSLSDALRVSFRLLSVIMVLVGVAFVMTGVQVVHANQAGIIKVFGKVVAVAPPGVAFTWPFPVGEMEIVDVSPRQFAIDDLWMYETPEDKLKAPSDRKPMSGGLRPAYDGALFTADRGLLHVQFVATYEIRDALACRKALASPAGADGALTNLVRMSVCSSAVETAAGWHADAIRNAPAAFAMKVREGAQKRLNAALAGREHAVAPLQALALSGLTARVEWPLQALGAFQDAQNAAREYETKIQNAVTEADNMLKSAAGPDYIKLVGQPWRTSNEAGPAEQAKLDLIGQYARVRAELDGPGGDKAALADKARTLLASIDQALERDVAGEAAAIRDRARATRTQIAAAAEERLRLFQKTLPGFLRSPALTLERLWAQTRQEILSGPLVEKYYINASDRGLVLRLSADPDIRRQIELKAIEDAKKKDRK
jgi:regulator of protease activity HflC (stomatin/prohibitin superfamily)